MRILVPKLALPSLTPRQRQIVAVALALALVPAMAHAQTADTIVQWFVTTYARGLINAGIIALAILFLLMRFSVGIVCAVAGGGLLFANRDAIAAMFGV
ncbi:MAG: hypothetical protein K2X84_04335 [Beijerinckiaceae bacterium]|nr:hypothetical protein [Beijerinckiaceae bacterium]